MKLGIISDVHANDAALREVIRFLRRENVEKIFCAGDIVGYYTRPNEVIDILQSERVQCIRGNHDDKAIGHEQVMNQYAKQAILWTINHLKRENIEYLSSLPDCYETVIDGRTICMYHGSPQSSLTDYVFEEDLSEELLNQWFHEKQMPDLLILGHTHTPFVVKIGRTTVVNPGSVAQSRSNDLRASCAIIDTVSMEAVIHRIRYDSKELAAEVRRELSRSLLDRLPDR